MEDLQGRVRAELRARLLERGGTPEFSDAEVFDLVERLFRHALDAQQRGALLLPALLGEEDEWRVDTPLRFSSHRPLVGPAVVFVKRRVLLPMMRWLHEHGVTSFRRQQRINEVVFACLQTLAAENARLRRELDDAAVERRSARRTGPDAGPGRA
jgi:hypothetical protein